MKKLKESCFFIDDKSFRIKFNEPLLGDMACENVSSEEGNIFTIIKKASISDLLVFKNDKNFFYKTPKKSDKKRFYILKYEAVGIIGEKDGWVNICYYGEKLVSGWMLKNRFYNF